MGRIDEDTRLAAVVAWRSASGHYKTAMQLFKQHPKFKSISRPDRVLKHYSLRAAQGQGLQDKQRSGRPRKLDQPTTARATQLFLAGSAQNGRQESFTGINEALSLNEELKGIVSTHNMSPRTLLRNMQSHTPSLKKRTEDLKPILNTRLKNLRLAACSKLLQFSDRYFKRIFWIDAKTMHIMPSARRVWVDSSLPMPVKSDSRMPRSGRDRRTLHFYSMVTWSTGPVAIMFVTGTSGLQHAQPYMVRQLVLKYAPEVLWPLKLIGACLYVCIPYD